MARQRMLWPAIWDDEDVGSLSDGAFRLFVACVSNADDEGKLEASARRLKGIAFRFRDDISIYDVESYRTELTKVLRSVVLYVIDGREYIILKNWLKYQTIRKPQESKIPNPNTAQCVTHADPVRTHCVPSDAPVRTDSINELDELEEVIETTETMVVVDGHESAVVTEFMNVFSHEIRTLGMKAQLEGFKSIYRQLGYDDTYLSLQFQQAVETCSNGNKKAPLQAVMNYLRKSTFEKIKAYKQAQANKKLAEEEAKKKNPYGYVTGMPCMCGRTRDGRTVTIPTERLEEAKADGVIIFTSEKAVNG